MQSFFDKILSINFNLNLVGVRVSVGIPTLQRVDKLLTRWQTSTKGRDISSK